MHQMTSSDSPQFHFAIGLSPCTAEEQMFGYTIFISQLDCIFIPSISFQNKVSQGCTESHLSDYPDSDLGVAFQTHPGSQSSTRGEAKDSALLSSRTGYFLDPTEWPKGSQSSCDPSLWNSLNLFECGEQIGN